MANKNRKDSGFTYEPMPETMFFDLKESQVRKEIAEREVSILNYIEKIRSKGISIKSEEDLKKFTPDYVREQIANSKKKRLQDTQFLPLAIRKREEEEFREMENELVPLADSVQGLLEKIPFRIHLGADAKDIYFNAEEVDRYIKEQCTEQIPEDIRQYYDELQKVCEAWQNLCTWAEAHGFQKPNMKLARKLMHEDKYIGVETKISDQDRCVFSLTPEMMFQIYIYGIVRKPETS